MFQRLRALLPNIYISLVIAAGVVAFSRGFQAWECLDRGKYLSFAVVTLLASRMKVKLPGIESTISLNFVFMLIGVSEFSLGEALLAGALGCVVQTFTGTKPKPVQIAFNLANMACAIQAAYAAQHWHNLRNVLPTAIVYFAVNTLLVATVVALTERKNFWGVWQGSYFWSFPNYLAGASAAWAVGATSRVIGWQPGMLLVPILYLIYRSHSMYIARLKEAALRADQQKAHAEEVAALHRRTVETLALAIEAKDQTTLDHLERVEIYSAEVGRELGLGETELEALRAAALLHDVGKIAVPEYIISKPGRLTPAEFEKMKTHTVVGSEIAERIRFPYPVAPLVRGHHEKWDGSGYPDGLAGEQIPVGARILAAVDCLDALASDRQYRRALPLTEALAILRSEAGKSFDARVVEILVRRAFELSRLVRNSPGKARLSVGVKVDRGEAPAVGFEDVSPPETGSSDLVNLDRAVSGAGNAARSLAERLLAMQRCADREAVLASLRSLLQDVVSCDLLVVYSVQGDLLVPVYLKGEDYRTFASLEIPMGAGLSGWVAENGKAIVNGNPSVEPGYLNDPASFSVLRSALAVPLISTPGITGVLSLYRKGANAFTHSHLGVLMSVSPILARALEVTSVPAQPVY